jgi:hypothetical protein
MVYLLWAPAFTAGASCLFGLGLTISKSLAAKRHIDNETLALPEIGYPALRPRPHP